MDKKLRALYQHLKERGLSEEQERIILFELEHKSSHAADGKSRGTGEGTVLLKQFISIMTLNSCRPSPL